jgi:transposase
MLPTSDLPISVHLIVVEQDLVVLVATGRVAAAICPECQTRSDRIHDRYVRRPLDQPWRGWTVRLRLRVRRFVCLNAACPRVTFSEDFGPALRRRAQRTTACTQLLTAIACALGGEAGARLAGQAGVPVSPDTLLRLERQAADIDAPTPRVLGVDDFALRRGRRYGTLLVDLETHRPIDLLHGRDADTLADWLRDHPGVEILVRDRAEAYAEGARSGAPTAQQVADRFHLLQNATAALNEVLQGRRRRVEIAARPETPGTPPVLDPTSLVVPPADPPLSQTEQRQADARARRVARWEAVRDLRAQGVSLRQIARDLGLARQTVRRLAATPEPPRNQRVRPPRPGGLTSPTLAPYVSYLQDRWQDGCTNASQLYREIVAQGYGGSRSLLSQAVQPWRPPRPPGQGAPRRGRRQRSVRGLCLRPPEQLTPEERRGLEQLLEQEPEIARGYALLQRFRTLIGEREIAALNAWLDDAGASALQPFRSLANGIDADRAAVEAALTTEWSNGPVEGHVHRLKLVKRRGYGRASFALLRRRVLAA